MVAAASGLPVSATAAAGSTTSVTMAPPEPWLSDLSELRPLPPQERFEQPLFNGYKDGLYSIALHVGGGLWAVCEIQLHLAAILVVKPNIGFNQVLVFELQSHI